MHTHSTAQYLLVCEDDVMPGSMRGRHNTLTLAAHGYLARLGRVLARGENWSYALLFSRRHSSDAQPLDELHVRG